jgi:hypothetical protein
LFKSDCEDGLLLGSEYGGGYPPKPQNPQYGEENPRPYGGGPYGSAPGPYGGSEGPYGSGANIFLFCLFVHFFMFSFSFVSTIMASIFC